MPTKKDKIIYWVSMIIIALFILPGIFFLNNQMAIEGTQHLGLPEWFRYESSIAVFLAGLALIIPQIRGRVKEWAYAGLGITYISALIAHLSVDGFVPMSFAPVVTFAILLVSYIYYQKIK